uniref:ATP synthase F0 subunit 6 n=1 Tax=Paragyrodactylus variegatus TaxID=1415179 RepID=A0A076VAI7_9PLAT|nr:ATP synthase F0 subunit 6 [Paragyrodactylus variegatus]AIK25762.1 ATP synthase F0 subunit 6 [Paragyrodactylus variegatus]
MIFNSYTNFIKFNIINLVNNNILSLSLVNIILFIFLLFRFPSIFDVYYFIILLFVLLMPYFLSLFLSRILNNSNEFFASFTPVGAPIAIAPFVCIAEGISYFVRPFVLILRPFLNLSIGSFGALAIGGFFVNSSSLLIFSLFIILFFYEIFVCLVHWFIVSNILIFSIDH